MVEAVAAQYSKSPPDPGKVFQSLGNVSIVEEVDDDPEKSFEQVKNLLSSVGGAFK